MLTITKRDSVFNNIFRFWNVTHTHFSRTTYLMSSIQMAFPKETSRYLLKPFTSSYPVLLMDNYSITLENSVQTWVRTLLAALETFLCIYVPQQSANGRTFFKSGYLETTFVLILGETTACKHNFPHKKRVLHIWFDSRTDRYNKRLHHNNLKYNKKLLVLLSKSKEGAPFRHKTIQPSFIFELSHP